MHMKVHILYIDVNIVTNKLDILFYYCYYHYYYIGMSKYSK